MAKFVLDFGREIDMLTKGELDASLAEAEDARVRALIGGVKPVEMFINQGTIGAGAAVYSTSGQPPMAPTSGYIWAIMNIGADLSASTALNIYKGVVSAVGTGGKVIAHIGASQAQSQAFSKGQLWLRPSEQLTFIPTAGNVLSVWVTAIEIPAERVGELLI